MTEIDTDIIAASMMGNIIELSELLPKAVPGPEVNTGSLKFFF